ncbi:hypothetical protein LJR098_002114 [Rhizobium sp. LjRoot98]|uniref:hypothetical protein n=1 Tax=unclassified Rhizobium TaxID=2613769 RepID=UPI0007150EB4|nr:hypothetical protein [Rhizobium sp. Root1204]KQV35296.1 hypothetical protein ASC96_29545 [Rhizobium sp. Root1204]
MDHPAVFHLERGKLVLMVEDEMFVPSCDTDFGVLGPAGSVRNDLISLRPNALMQPFSMPARRPNGDAGRH